MKYQTGLGSIQSSLSSNRNFSLNIKASIGKVYGVITTPNTPNSEIYSAYGGESGIGTVFIKDYSEYTKNDNTINYSDTGSYKVAKPLFSWLQDYPVIGELVLLTDNAPSIDTQKDKGNNTGVTLYYIGSLNLWNSPQENAPAGGNLGKTFTENSEIRRLLSFEGDRIILGRKGNGIRFGSTVSLLSDLNEWSSTGNNGDPITIMVNGYVTSDTGSQFPNIEEINKEKSSIYMTSTQKIPLLPGAIIKNPFNSSLPPEKYNKSQVILNSDRITFNSKRDEILMFSKSNIELSTDNIINLNAGKIIHLHIDEKNPNSQILLGTRSNGEIPYEAVLLGNQTAILFERMFSTLQNLAYYLSIGTTPQGPITPTQLAGAQLFADIKGLCSQLDKCLSTKVYTV
jgi:hypothetical protein